MNQTTTRRLTADSNGVTEAVRIWAAGGLVAFPTETVYGLGADARDGRAVAGIYEAKQRPSFNPLIVHVPDMAAAAHWVDFNDTARLLAQTFWPGALTLVLPLRPDTTLSKLVTAGHDTLAIRIPDHPLARDILHAFGGPVAAPSANPSGRISPTTAEHVLNGLGGRIDAVIDGGACPVGLESTIVRCSGKPAILREGGIAAEALAACLGLKTLQQASDDPHQPKAPGQLASHYAPNGSVRLEVTAPQPDEIMLGFGNVPATLNLSTDGDLVEAAANLFRCLHQLDAMGAKKIAVSPVPHHGLGLAINDRLRRAAADRPD